MPVDTQYKQVVKDMQRREKDRYVPWTEEIRKAVEKLGDKTSQVGDPLDDESLNVRVAPDDIAATNERLGDKKEEVEGQKLQTPGAEGPTQYESSHTRVAPDEEEKVVAEEIQTPRAEGPGARGEGLLEEAPRQGTRVVQEK